MQIQMSYFIAERRLFFVSVVAIFAVTVKSGDIVYLWRTFEWHNCGFRSIIIFHNMAYHLYYWIFPSYTNTDENDFSWKREIEFYLSNWLTLSQKFRSIITKS